MDLESVILSEVSQTEKQKNRKTFPICGILKEIFQTNLFMKEKQTHRLREQIYDCWGGIMAEEIVRKLRMDMNSP